MLRANPHHERTYHDHAVHSLLAERNALIRNIPELAPLATHETKNEAVDPLNGETNTNTSAATSEAQKAYYNASPDDVKLLNEAKYKLFLEQEHEKEDYFGHNLKPRHPPIETPLHTVADNFTTPNMQDVNLYRSYPIYHTPMGNSDNRLSPRDFGPVSNTEKDDDFSVLEGLRAMGFEGLKREDQVRKAKPQKEHAEKESSKCHCSHGFEPCCETKKHSDAEVHYYEAPVTHHYRSESHYCITGDEPYCKVLRDLRAKTTSKKEKSKVVKQAQTDVKKPVPQKEADPAARGRSKAQRSRKFEDPVPER